MITLAARQFGARKAELRICSRMNPVHLTFGGCVTHRPSFTAWLRTTARGARRGRGRRAAAAAVQASAGLRWMSVLTHTRNRHAEHRFSPSAYATVRVCYHAPYTAVEEHMRHMLTTANGVHCLCYRGRGPRGPKCGPQLAGARRPRGRHGAQRPHGRLRLLLLHLARDQGRKS